MKVVTLALAIGGNGTISGQDTEMQGRALSLDARIQNAQDKCGYFMEKAMFCEPPSGKQGKYAFRMNKVSRLDYIFNTKDYIKIMYDAVHHNNRNKCSGKRIVNYGSYRRRRDAIDDALAAEFEQVRAQIEAESNDFTEKGKYGESPKRAPRPKLVDRLENICRKYMANVWNAQEVENCKKLGAWERRSKGLLDHLTLMKNVCRNTVAYIEPKPTAITSTTTEYTTKKNKKPNEYKNGQKQNKG